MPIDAENLATRQTNCAEVNEAVGQLMATVAHMMNFLDLDQRYATGFAPSDVKVSFELARRAAIAKAEELIVILQTNVEVTP